MNSSLLSSKKQDWSTPQEFYDALDAEFHFTLDAAATKKNAKCSAYFTPEDDALKKKLGNKRRCFLQSAIRTGNTKMGAQGVRRITKRASGGYAVASANGHELFPRLHIRVRRNPVYPWSATIHGRKWEQKGRRTISKHDRDIREEGDIQ